MRLNEISDKPGATSARKRLGRGIGSGLGKTSGKGQKGQKARTGVAIKGFEGGQMPLHRRLPKRGFKNIFARRYNEVNLGRVQSAIDDGRLDGKAAITADALLAAGLIRRKHDGVRLLGNGEISVKLAFEVTGASQSAIKAVEAKGGSVTIVAPKAAQPTDGEANKKQRAKPAKQEAEGAETKAEEAKPAKPKREAKAKDEAGGGGSGKADQAEAKKPRAKPAKKDK